MLSLKRLPGTRRLARRFYTNRPKLGTVQQETRKQQTAPPPFGSMFEYVTWLYISKRDPFWQPQVRFGRYGTRGSTTVDFLNNVLRVALYISGEYVHKYRRAADVYIQQQMKARGYRVVEWTFVSLQDVEREIARLYQRDIGN